MNIFTVLAMSLSFNNPNLLSAVCWIETRHQNIYTADDVGSPSYGDCQIKLDTANWMHHQHIMDGPYLNHSDMLKQEISIFYAALYLKHQIERYPGDLRCGISAYNAGRCIKGNQKTYVDRVMKRLAILDTRNDNSLAEAAAVIPLRSSGHSFATSRVIFRQFNSRQPAYKPYPTRR